MAESKNTVIVSGPSKSLRQRVSEMIGRNDPLTRFVRNLIKVNVMGSAVTVDESRVNYTLARALYNASVMTDPTTGKKYGKEYILGAHLARPIVNAAAAFVIGTLPQIQADKKFKKQIDEMTDWFKDNQSSLLYTVRNTFRDGDVFLRVSNDLKMTRLAPWAVEKVLDPVSGELMGYDITSSVEGENGQLDKYVEEVRKVSPFRQVRFFKGSSGNGVIQANFTESGSDSEERPLQIIHFANEKEDDQIYGFSDYQNIFYLIANYHAVTENMVKNNIYNSNAVPFLTGVENIGTFIEENGEKQDDGTYKMKWDPNKLLVGGAGFDAKTLSAPQNANDADKVLNLLFWNIIQASETPEFVMGTAVSSSKASVEEQTPVMVKKAERKQKMLTEPFNELLDLFVYLRSQTDNSFSRETMNPKINWGSIVDEDKKLTLDTIRLLSDLGAITDKTALLLTGVDSKIEDVDIEIESAHNEMEEKAKKANPFGPLDNQPEEENANPPTANR